jgi:hypothetical protein
MARSPLRNRPRCPGHEGPGGGAHERCETKLAPGDSASGASLEVGVLSFFNVDSSEGGWESTDN